MHHLQGEGLIPGRVERTLNGFGLLLDLAIPRRYLYLDIGVSQTIGVHGDEVLGIAHCVTMTTPLV